MPIVGTNNYPSIETVTNLARSFVLDDMPGASDTVGEGQIFVDALSVSVTMQNFFNSALRELCRQLRIVDSPTFIRDNYILTGLPIVNGPQGSGTPDPAVQQYLSFTGFFDGSLIWPNFTLPADCYQVEVVWERITGSNNPFCQMTQPARALQSGNQGVSWGEWEWRNDQIWIRGALQPNDMRIRYQSNLQNIWQAGVDVSQTYIAILNCEESLAAKIAKNIAVRNAPERYAMISDLEKMHTNNLILEQSKRAQGYDYCPREFGNEDPILM